ncbi:MAG: replication-associated recombination protein A [Ruminococcaceae bacterium]|nr:replication-associated recombination protein A [Oscillospiraceae bacterium]
MYQPLADLVRPKEFSEVVGQDHILNASSVFRRSLDAGNISNMIFYGPSGVGKTTVASIIASKTDRTLYKLNATTASIADIKEICSQIGGLTATNGILLYLDEIQYFNKKQQQSLLEFIENGSIVLIASTTENPYFYVYNAILSRSTVFEFKPVSAESLKPCILRAVGIASDRAGVPIAITDDALAVIASGCGGDVRKAINAVELLTSAVPTGVDSYEITEAEALEVTQRSAMRYDRDGDAHYDILSALQKSVRGSDPDAALHYLARLLTANDLPSACRRLLVMASEDVGMAYPQAVPIVKACVDSALQLGLPEAQLPLGEAVVLLATAPKSNSSANGIWSAMADVAAGKTGDIPAHLKDAHYSGAAKLGRGKTYLYPHSYKHHYVRQQYLPDALKDVTYYQYGENKLEQATKRYWDEVKKDAEDPKK